MPRAVLLLLVVLFAATACYSKRAATAHEAAPAQSAINITWDKQWVPPPGIISLEAITMCVHRNATLGYANGWGGVVISTSDGKQWKVVSNVWNEALQMNGITMVPQMSGQPLALLVAFQDPEEAGQNYPLFLWQMPVPGAWEEWQQLPDPGLWPNRVQFSNQLNGIMVPQFPPNEDKAPAMTVWVTLNGGARGKDWTSVKLPSWPTAGKNAIYMKNDTIILTTQLGACTSSNYGKSFSCKNATISGAQQYIYIGTFFNATFGVALATDLKTQKGMNTITTVDGGMTWSVVAAFEPAVAITKMVLLSDEVYFVNYWSNGNANLGGFVYTDDGGMNWYNATNGDIPWDQLYNDFDVMVTSHYTAELWTVSASNGVVYHASIGSSKKLVQLDTPCHHNG